MIQFSLQQVRGEIYEVDSTSLARLDEFEDHPNMYERFEIPIQQIVGICMPFIF